MTRDLRAGSGAGVGIGAELRQAVGEGHRWEVSDPSPAESRAGTAR